MGKEYAVTPINCSQKSFYGKAKAREEDGFFILRSYETDVAKIDCVTGQFFRLWNGYSSTSLRHVNSFKACFALYGKSLTKKEWEALEVEA